MSSSSSSSKPAKRPSVGRQKIEIKRVEQSSKRHVTFSKRKLGLFRKAAELSLLCDSEIAVIVFSQNGKIYSSGHPEPDSVIRRYLFGASSNPPPLRDLEIESAMSSLRQEYEESKKELEEEKKRLDAISEIHGSGRGYGFWWNNPIADMDLENVEQFKVCAEQLRQNLVAAAEKKRLIQSPPMMTATEFPYVPMLNGDLVENLETDQPWDYSWNGCTSGSSFLIPDSLRHY